MQKNLQGNIRYETDNEALDMPLYYMTSSERTLCVDLFYPGLEKNISAIEVGLMDVRAADGIRVSYDFDRDGWKIEQASIFQWDADDEECDPGWKEVAFIQAWALEVEPAESV